MPPMTFAAGILPTSLPNGGMMAITRRVAGDAQAVLPGPLPRAACAAASRAIGTRNGEQDT